MPVRHLAKQLLVVACATVALSSACTDSSSGDDTSGSSGSGLPGSDVCPGTEPWPEGTQTCRSDAECDGSSYCASAPYANSCGGCVPTFQGCQIDGDCGGGGVCEPYGAPQGPCDCEPAMVCVANCNQAACAAGFNCEVDGHCTALACGAGYTCPSDKVCDAQAAGKDVHDCVAKPCDAGYSCSGNAVCDPGATGADAHGCRPLHCSEGFVCGENQRCNDAAAGNGCISLTCATDLNCDCGACVKGICVPRIGACFGYPS